MYLNIWTLATSSAWGPPHLSYSCNSPVWLRLTMDVHSLEIANSFPGFTRYSTPHVVLRALLLWNFCDMNLTVHSPLQTSVIIPWTNVVRCFTNYIAVHTPLYKLWWLHDKILCINFHLLYENHTHSTVMLCACTPCFTGRYAVMAWHRTLFFQSKYETIRTDMS